MSSVREWQVNPTLAIVADPLLERSSLKCDRVSIWADFQTSLRYSDNPVEPGGCNRGMKVVNLVGGDRRSPEEGESYVRKDSVLCGARSPVLALHDAIVCCRATKRDSIAPVIGAHAGERTAPSNASFKIVNMRGLQVCTSRLIVAAVLIEPGDGEGLGATVCRR
jgi:hypothetical protein